MSGESRAFTVVTCWLVLTAGSAPAAKPSTAALAAKPATGWSAYRFGMSLDEAVRARPDVRWSAFALENCRQRRRARYGCSLVLPDKSTLRVGRNGLAFAPTLSFVNDRLSEIWLSHEQRGSIRPSRCLRSYAAILDGLWRGFGPFSSPYRPTSWVRQGWRIDIVRTRGGSEFALGHPWSYPDFSIEQSRTHRPASIPAGSTDGIDTRGGAHVRLSGNYVFWERDPAVCMITVAYISTQAAHRYAYPER